MGVPRTVPIPLSSDAIAASIPVEPGTYLLVLRSSTAGEIAVGRLGPMGVERGFYLYVGSAFGPGGLRARIARHARPLGPAKRPHWHIDHLREMTDLVDVWYTCESVSHEHEWARALLECKECRVPLPGFGSSDCHCVSHLSFLRNNVALRGLARHFDVCSI